MGQRCVAFRSRTAALSVFTMTHILPHDLDWVFKRFKDEFEMIFYFHHEFHAENRLPFTPSLSRSESLEEEELMMS